jgi:hypothetical protein
MGTYVRADRFPSPPAVGSRHPDLHLTVPRWLFAEDVVLDREGNAHGRDCSHAPTPEDQVLIHAGEQVTRRAAPRPCWTCQPDMTMLIGPADDANPPRNLD